MGNGGSSMEVKLYLGCGDVDKRSEGYKNVDVRQLPHVDVVADVSETLPFDDDSVDVILAESVLEHIPHNLKDVPTGFRMSRTIKVLSDWKRVLKPGGKLILRVPNFEALANQYISKKISSVDLIGYICGGGEYDQCYHMALFDVPIMGACLRNAGFSNFKFVDPHKYSDGLDRENGWEMGVIAIKGGQA